jgi:hypothetical protein
MGLAAVLSAFDGQFTQRRARVQMNSTSSAEKTWNSFRRRALMQ